MNYRHAFHAGSFSDVFKHLLLMTLLQALQQKDTAFCYLDTHAGIGLYDLNTIAAQKTKEYETGILPLLQAAPSELKIVEQYVDILAQYNNLSRVTLYPGSPLIAKHCLRSQDKMILTELHPEDANILKELFSGDKQVAAHHQNGYSAMKAFLPPKEKRGLVMIDPAFENKTEWEDIITAVTSALHHWRNGQFAIWYPIKKTTHLQSTLKSLDARIPLVQIEVLRFPNDVGDRLNGCGMLVLNPPWKLAETFRPILNYLKTALSLYKTSFVVKG
jgi:23S rRNA (adenine2030-N6)-methyltransferase